MLEIILAAQINCLAEAVFAEARGEPYAGQVLVAAVVKNRVLDQKFSGDFCSVIKEPYQFSFVDEVTQHQLERRIENEPEAWEMAQEVAYSVFFSGDGELLDGVLYYHADSITPKWNYRKIEKIEHLGNHIFYVDR